MRRVRIGIIGAGALTEGAILPVLSGPDATAPLDNGAWWTRRPSAHVDIQYQAPVRPEVVALAESDAVRGTRVAHSARVRAIYTDWRQMVREAPLDALVCASSVETNLEVLSILALGSWRHSLRWMWISGPPANTAAQALELSRLPALSQVWCARPLRQAAAHRTARRLVQRGEIGAVHALAMRWPAPFFAPVLDLQQPVATYALASNYAALDLLLAFGSIVQRKDEKRVSESSPVVQPVQQVFAVGNAEATSVVLRFHNGVVATATFAAAEEWSAPWPRLEICGVDGRGLLCESGRQVTLYEPREPSRVLSPPGISPLISSANLLGVAEELKLFLMRWEESSPTHKSRENAATATDETACSDLRQAAAVLQVVEAVQESLHTGMPVMVPSLPGETALTVQGSAIEFPFAEQSDEELGLDDSTLPLRFD